VTYHFKIEKLESMGCSVEDWQLVDPTAGIFEPEYWFMYDERLYFTNDVYHTIEEQLKHSTELSLCCNYEVNQVWRFCPNCDQSV